MTVLVPSAARIDASATIAADDVSLQSNLICVEPPVTPTIRGEVAVGTISPVPAAIVRLHTAVDAAWGVTVVAEAPDVATKDIPATSNSADAPPTSFEVSDA
jgi:hypothetical protein